MRMTEFWDNLCGENLWQQLGLAEKTQEAIAKFDKGIFDFYPYFEKYLLDVKDKKVLEIGFGRGWLGRRFMSMGADYHGLEKSKEACKLMEMYSRNIHHGSVLGMPYQDHSFDIVYSIGCLHHTGNLPCAVNEVYRVLRPGGTAIVMIYNSNSFRYKIFLPLFYLYSRFTGKNIPKNYWSFARWYYDGSGDQVPPHTDFTTPYQARRLFRQFSHVTICQENFDGYSFPSIGINIKREMLLNSFLSRHMGLDLYIKATK